MSKSSLLPEPNEMALKVVRRHHLNRRPGSCCTERHRTNEAPGPTPNHENRPHPFYQDVSRADINPAHDFLPT